MHGARITKDLGQKKYRVSISPHMSPENDPSSFCSPAISNSRVKNNKMTEITLFYIANQNFQFYQHINFLDLLVNVCLWPIFGQKICKKKKGKKGKKKKKRSAS